LRWRYIRLDRGTDAEDKRYFVRPIGLALDSDGTLYVSELEVSDIRRIDPQGM
jgi:sugar lactone lactonase YvrE